MRKFLIVLMVILAFALFAKQKIVLNSYASDPAPKKALAELVKMFEEKYPDYEVVVNTFAHEDFKTLLRTWLNSPDAPDVVTWFAGERMRYFASKGLLEPLDDIFTDKRFDSYFPAAFKSSCEYKGKIYFLPQSWYWWGVYYRKSVFEKYGLKTPKTWEEFLKVCEILKNNGITPIAIGTKYLWTAAGWFDYLNMRINGLEFHKKLTAGEIPYTDPRVKKIFDYWKVLVEKGYFLENHPSYSWQEAASFLFRGEAGMYLMGQFIKDVAPEEVKNDLDFFRFPIIDEKVGLYEDTPIDGFMIPAKAKHKEAAKFFLKFIASKEAQEFYAKSLGRLAANKNVPAPDAHAEKGLKMILASDGVMQFYDRDTNPEMATVGMNGFVEFMVYPNNIDKILENLEKARKRIFKK
ncbi:MAG: carbohydrate ABC transporter substrate-binding protein [Thermotogae bacterium]|nr:MAG: carbohydrate ABC transporter substrate-binding protein [Thermotogota bacterium]